VILEFLLWKHVACYKYLTEKTEFGQLLRDWLQMGVEPKSHPLAMLLSSTQGEDYLVENFSATSGGKFSESTKNQIFGANMCKTLI